MIAPPTRVLFPSTQGYDLFDSFVSDIIYNTRLLKGCQYMTVTYVVVTLAVVEQQSFQLSDPNKDHNSYDLQYQCLHLPETTIPIVPCDFVYAILQHALDEY